MGHFLFFAFDGDSALLAVRVPMYERVDGPVGGTCHFVDHNRSIEGSASRPVWTLLAYGIGAIVFGAVFAHWGSTVNKPFAPTMGIFIGEAALVIGGAFLYGAWYYASGRASMEDVDLSQPRQTMLRSLVAKLKNP
jgi:hypothetical protein